MSAPRSIAEYRAPQRGEPAALVPRFQGQGYSRLQVDERRSWLEARLGCRLTNVGGFTISSVDMRGNVENPIGASQVPIGVAGPLTLRGDHAQGVYYVPLATTEGALVRSYERGMLAITRAGGAVVRVLRDENRISPSFLFRDLATALKFAAALPRHLDEIRAEAEATTRHGKLLGLECLPSGRQVIVNLRFSTGDAHGMNMIAKAADAACRWILHRLGAQSYSIFSGYNSEKRASGSLLAGGKGKKVVAGVALPHGLVRTFLGTTPEEMAQVWRQTVVGHLHTAALGYNGHYANGLAALFIACGQDVANVANSAVGITQLEVTAEGDLHASVTLPSLTVATVGGGTGLGTGRECLEMLDCAGAGKARKLAEITAGTLLAGEISMAAAIASGEFVEAHETYGRNRPSPAPPPAVAGSDGGAP